MRIFVLPASVLALVMSHVFAADNSSAYLTAATTRTNSSTSTRLIEPTGSGPEYASSCSSLVSSYSSAYSAWSRDHQTSSTQLQVIGGNSVTVATYYQNATTLCDGRPRVTYSPAISLSVGTTTEQHPVISTKTDVITYWLGGPSNSPSCSIKPTDCDPLWAAYSKSLTAGAPYPTNPPMTPPCLNQSAASSYADFTSSLYGCGACTMYGQDVQLVYFPVPTTVSRDMCASTPTQALTTYGPGAVITAYAGMNYTGDQPIDASAPTAVANGHTFTSGTAYISIGSVWAEDRCFKTKGTPVSNVILAMPSQSVLSLRYRQDHFQYFVETSQQTGYPVSYADFNSPVPLSAYVGMEMCEGPWDTWYCGIIYESQFRPQLAIPPQVRDLDPEFAGCQLWYGGLWDPPLALTQAEAAAKATLPAAAGPKTTQAAPSSTVPATTSAPTALPDHEPTASRDWSDTSAPTALSDSDPPASQGWSDSGRPGSSSSNGWSSVQPSQSGGSGGAGSKQSDAGSGSRPSNTPWTRPFTVPNGQTYTAAASGTIVVIRTITLTMGQAPQTIESDIWASYGNNRLSFWGSTTIVPSVEASAEETSVDCPACLAILSGISATPIAIGTAVVAKTYTVTLGGQQVTAVQSSAYGPIVIDESKTLTPGGAVATWDNGDVASAASGGLVIGWTSVLNGDKGTSSMGSVNSESTSSVHGSTGSGVSAGTTGTISNSLARSSAASSTILNSLARSSAAPSTSVVATSRAAASMMKMASFGTVIGAFCAVGSWVGGLLRV